MISNPGDYSSGISNGGLYIDNDFMKKYRELTQYIVDATVKATEFVIGTNKHGSTARASSRVKRRPSPSWRSITGRLPSTFRST